MGSEYQTASAPVFQIQHFCLHDGPGIRSIVFLKGCPLRCAWCQNPESWRKAPETGFKKNLCAGCGSCVSACESGALKSPGSADRELCAGCFECASACPSGALSVFGRYLTAGEVFEEIKNQIPFYKNSGGGVTLSGGEPSLYPEFGEALGRILRIHGIPLCIETCGYGNGDNYPYLKSIPEAADIMLFDLKLFDNDRHREFCGVDNRRILDNFAVMHSSDKLRLWPRLPLIPEITATDDNIGAWADFLSGLGIDYITLVPYHKLGLSKREWFNLDMGIVIPMPGPEDIENAENLLRRKGIRPYKPGEEEWA